MNAIFTNFFLKLWQPEERSRDTSVTRDGNLLFPDLSFIQPGPSAQTTRHNLPTKGSAIVQEGKFILRVVKILEIPLIYFTEKEAWTLWQLQMPLFP